jgi:hypothetical protein
LRAFFLKVSFEWKSEGGDGGFAWEN